MALFDPAALKLHREKKGMTQEALALASKVDKQTIHRLERGKLKRPHARTLKQLADALKLEVTDLFEGSAPLPADIQEPFDNRSDMQIRIDNGARNALTLTAIRYGIGQNRIVEIAPFLFVCAAEASLQRRAARLADLEARQTETENRQTLFAHLSSLLTSRELVGDIVDAERASIDQRDLFGEDIPYDGGAIFNSDCDEFSDNPFVRYLADMATSSAAPAASLYWTKYTTPTYEICPEEAADLVGKDAKAAKAILEGEALLHKMPAAVLAGPAAGRAKWALDESAAYDIRLANEPDPTVEELMAGMLEGRP
ncbi:hypothetical protein BH11PSE2_BH11PSE2_08450 [soil metagenome]